MDKNYKVKITRQTCKVVGLDGIVATYSLEIGRYSGFGWVCDKNSTDLFPPEDKIDVLEKGLFEQLRKHVIGIDKHKITPEEHDYNRVVFRGTISCDGFSEFIDEYIRYRKLKAIEKRKKLINKIFECSE